MVATAAAIIDRRTSEIHSSGDGDAHGETTGRVCLRRWNDGCRVISERRGDEGRWPGGWVLRGIDERVVIGPGALVVDEILVLLVGRSEGEGMICHLNVSFADADVLADANFYALICERTGEGGGLLVDE